VFAQLPSTRRMARPGGATPRFPGFRLGRESGAADVPYTPRVRRRPCGRCGSRPADHDVTAVCLAACAWAGRPPQGAKVRPQRHAPWPLAGVSSPPAHAPPFFHAFCSGSTALGHVHVSHLHFHVSRFTPMLPREYPGGLETGVRGPATDSRDEMVAKRGHFARLRELRAHFHASAAPDENDGPFDEKDHPCLVRRSTASSRPGVVPSHSKPERAHLSGKRRQAQTAPSALANAYKLVPFRESILSGSHSKVSELQSFSNDTLHDLAPIRVWSSPRSAGAVSLRSQGQSPRRPNSSRTTAVHPHQLLSPPGPLRAPGPTASAEGPVISVQKIIPAKQIKKTDLKAHVVQMHSFLELPPGQVNIDFLEELAKRREKFLLRALHYLGIPYRAGARPRRDQRLGPAAMEQKTNFSKEALYLDCCGMPAMQRQPAKSLPGPGSVCGFNLPLADSLAF